MDPLVHLENIVRTFPSTPPVEGLKDVPLTINRGE